jgi:hypothetical protein
MKNKREEDIAQLLATLNALEAKLLAVELERSHHDHHHHEHEHAGSGARTDAYNVACERRLELPKVGS